MQNAPKLRIGGAAGFSGLILQSPSHWVRATRTPEGQVALQSGANYSMFTRQPWLRKVPLVRGAVFLLEAIVNAVLRGGDARKRGFPKTLLLILALSLTVPALVASAPVPTSYASVLWAQIAVVAAFLAIIRFTSLSGYHGAEHKVIAAYEAGTSGSMEGASEAPRIHARCGTNLAVPFLLCLAVSAWFGLNLALQVLLLTASLELFLYATRNPSHTLSKGFLRGGFLLQRLTTREPREQELQVAAAALGWLLALERGAEENL